MCAEELAWAAGFFDGEGSSGVQRDPRGRGYKYLRLQLRQVRREPIERFIAATGFGRLLGPYTIRGSIKSDKLQYAWSVQGAAAEILADLLYPYLSVPKREQIDAARAEINGGLDG